MIDSFFQIKSIDPCDKTKSPTLPAQLLDDALNTSSKEDEKVICIVNKFLS